MTSRSDRLSRRFPVGTKFVIEGRSGGEGQMQVFKRYIELPNGIFFALPARSVQRKSSPRALPPRSTRQH